VGGRPHPQRRATAVPDNRRRAPFNPNTAGGERILEDPDISQWVDSETSQAGPSQAQPESSQFGEEWGEYYQAAADLIASGNPQAFVLADQSRAQAGQSVNIAQYLGKDPFDAMLPEPAAPFHLPDLAAFRDFRGTDPDPLMGHPFHPADSYLVPPRSQVVINARWAGSRNPTDGRNFDQVLSPNEALGFTHQLLGAHCVIRSSQKEFPYLVTNVGDRPLRLTHDLVLGYGERVKRKQVRTMRHKGKAQYIPLQAGSMNLIMSAIDQNSEHQLGETPLYERRVKTTKELRSDSNLPAPPCTLSREELKAAEKYFVKEETLTSAQKRALIKLLQKHDAAFAQNDMDMGEFQGWKHHIDTGDAEPIHCNPHRLAFHFRDHLKKELDDLLANKIIEPSTSPWAAPVTYVPKADGSWRLCVDFRKLNAVAKLCVYPLPRIEDIFDTLEGSKFFTAIDLAKGFWQVALDDESKEKAAFTTIFGQYQYRRVPFGLATSPGAFQKVLNTVLAGLNWVHCMVYLDDVLIFSPTFERHLETIDQVLTRLTQANLKIKLKKCEWARTELRYLGHVINSKGKKPDPKKRSLPSRISLHLSARSRSKYF
jgi:hypothetical protein